MEDKRIVKVVQQKLSSGPHEYLLTRPAHLSLQEILNTLTDSFDPIGNVTPVAYHWSQLHQGNKSLSDHHAEVNTPLRHMGKSVNTSHVGVITTYVHSLANAGAREESVLDFHNSKEQQTRNATICDFDRTWYQGGDGRTFCAVRILDWLGISLTTSICTMIRFTAQIGNFMTRKSPIDGEAGHWPCKTTKSHRHVKISPSTNLANDCNWEKFALQSWH